MQVVSIVEFIYASYTDIRYMETEPLFIIGFMLARIGELAAVGENIRVYLMVSAVVFVVFLFGCAWFSLGGADALIASLICLNLGFYGIYAVITGLLISIPALLLRKGKEIPLIPFLSLGYVTWLILLRINY